MFKTVALSLRKLARASSGYGSELPRAKSQGDKFTAGPDATADSHDPGSHTRRLKVAIQWLARQQTPTGSKIINGPSKDPMPAPRAAQVHSITAARVRFADRIQLKTRSRK